MEAANEYFLDLRKMIDPGNRMRPESIGGLGVMGVLQTLMNIMGGDFFPKACTYRDPIQAGLPTMRYMALLNCLPLPPRITP